MPTPTTQRAYTLRIRGLDNSDHSWRDSLWATHEAVNQGAKTFGEWLLTMRGGLAYDLAEEGPPEQRKDRRILLALSWLSVEDAHGAPQDGSLIAAKGTDSTDRRARSLCDALVAILKLQAVPDAVLGNPLQPYEQQPNTWLGDCMASLHAAIREDAVWVNRNAVFNQAVAQGLSLAQQEIWDFLGPFFDKPDTYLKPNRVDSDETIEGNTAVNEDKSKALAQSAGTWLSARMGDGTGTDYDRMSQAYEAIANWASSAVSGIPGPAMLERLTQYLAAFSPPSGDAKGVLSVISGRGRPSAGYKQISALILAMGNLPQVPQETLVTLAELASKNAGTSKSMIGVKGRRTYADHIIQKVQEACGFTYLQTIGSARHSEFSVMLDHAARRVNVAHSWIKNAEASRKQFESDAQKISDVPSDALAWLTLYCTKRAHASGSHDEFRIRKRAIGGWDNVVNQWSQTKCQTTEDRIVAARMLQDAPEIDKFGDIQLFESLAADDAICVWKPNGTPNSQPLKDFVAATDAVSKMKRFKVPAYRHPDPLRHPVFTDFGNSRWGIDYSVHRRPVKESTLQSRVNRIEADLAAAEAKLATANEAKRDKQKASVAESRHKLKQAKDELSELQDQHRFQLKLWNGTTVKQVALRWSCKRLYSDLALRSSRSYSQEIAAVVSRADRLGIAAKKVGRQSQVMVAGLFEQKHWNGRLQAPREQLNAIARYIDQHGSDAKARKMLSRIRWTISFSAELSQLGPWLDYCDLFPDDAISKPFVSPRGEYRVKHQTNELRKGYSNFMLSRLPGLRVLSVDLGHRYAAACAVWEAITTDQLQSACVAAGAQSVTSDAMYVHLKSTNSRGKPITTIYRRIASDKLLDGTPHPASWARLDRQFLIKLQGEDRPTRKASPYEIRLLKDFELWAGLVRHPGEVTESMAVDALMNDAVRTARLALSRHGRRARIADSLVAESRNRPGARKVVLDDNGRIELLTDTLVDWHALAVDTRWNDDISRELWNSFLGTLPGGFEIDAVRPIQVEYETTRSMRRQSEELLRNRLTPLATALARNVSLRQELHIAWTAYWQSLDKLWREKLKWLGRWLMPRGGKRSDGSRRNVGGLSLTRISTLTEFRRKVQVGFYTRLRPDGTRAENGLRFGQATLDTINRLKEQRVKQLASRIVEAALGVGIERRSASGRDLSRPREHNTDPRFAPCHAVVIEDLSRYRPEETRTRRENRATLDWKSAETRKRLFDQCQLHGLHLRDVNPKYTSRQDSRTGAPGLRCIDLPVTDFLTNPWWRKQVAHASNKAQESKGDSRDLYLLALEAKWANVSEQEKTHAQPLRIPVNGGELFISAHENSPPSSGIQADLNAAANIGLRALMDPDFPGKWWYVPSDPTTRKPHAEKLKGSILENVGPLQVIALGVTQESRKRKGVKGNSPPKQVVNLWRDPAAESILGGEYGEIWVETPAYWNTTKQRVVHALRKRSGLALD